MATVNEVISGFDGMVRPQEPVPFYMKLTPDASVSAGGEELTASSDIHPDASGIISANGISDSGDYICKWVPSTGKIQYFAVADTAEGTGDLSSEVFRIQGLAYRTKTAPSS